MAPRPSRIERVLVVAAVVLVVLVHPVGEARASTPAGGRWLVPAYFYPDHWNAGNPWHEMCDGLRASAPGSTVVMNPSSGPDRARNADYQHVLSYCQAAGQKVIGYVYTSYGKRSARSVKADIDAYYRYYPGIDGVFLDEMSNDPGTQPYYRGVYRHVKAKSGMTSVVGNPGSAAATSWQLDAPVADAVVVFEGLGSTFAQWTPPSWVLAQPPSRMIHLVHASPDETTMAAACNRSRETNAGLIYVTDDVLVNPWDSLPSYWQEALLSC